MTLEELEKIQNAICDTHKCGPNCPNRRAEIDNWDDCAFCSTVFRYPGYEEWLKKHPIILKKALDRIKEKKSNG
ncbi:MAG: hypothetical protein IKE41_03580 [Clostridia bacterium]|nr:hypothetical protein [Clostridia bacterium]MBR7064034.1 hypothetical protein [Treponema sp.]